MGSVDAPQVCRTRSTWLSSSTHPSPSRTCAPFAPTLSVRIYGHFLPFPIFLARRTLCSAPPCTPDACTNGPHVVCSLCTLVSMTYTPPGGTEEPTHKKVCRCECGQFCHFGTCEYNSGYQHAMVHGDLWAPSICGPTLDSHWVPHRRLSPVCRPSWRNTLGILSILAHFWVCQNNPLWDPNFCPPSCGQLAAPHLHAHGEPGPNLTSCT